MILLASDEPRGCHRYMDMSNRHVAQYKNVYYNISGLMVCKSDVPSNRFRKDRFL